MCDMYKEPIPDNSIPNAISPNELKSILDRSFDDAYEKPLNYCPICKSNRYVKIEVTGTYGAGISINCKGAHPLHGCIDCGAVYIPESIRRKLVEEFNKEDSDA